MEKRIDAGIDVLRAVLQTALKAYGGRRLAVTAPPKKQRPSAIEF